MERMEFVFILIFVLTIIIAIIIITREENSHKYQHLMELMEFAFALQNSVDDFNQSLIEFDLVLRLVQRHQTIHENILFQFVTPGSGSTMGTSRLE